jgi:hypothetical protein
MPIRLCQGVKFMLKLLPLDLNAKKSFLEGHAKGHADRQAGTSAPGVDGKIGAGYPYWHGYKAGFNLPLGLNETAEREAAARHLKAYIALAMRVDDISKHRPPK